MKITKTASGKQEIKISKSEWLAIGKKAGWSRRAQFGNKESLSLGPTPAGEQCAQLGSDDYHKWSRIEIRAYANQIKRMFPNMPAGLILKISSNPHDFGTYHELDVVYLTDDEEAETYAFNMENGIPEYWDEQATQELQEQGYPYL